MTFFIKVTFSIIACVLIQAISLSSALIDDTYLAKLGNLLVRENEYCTLAVDVLYGHSSAALKPGFFEKTPVAAIPRKFL